MVSNSKVLTVSYGTFSCTLEGFDDSFDTMKAIAEYFRDLAADDRYFGAEPPTPDAEMLARIAEREIERRVQAREERGAIVLTAATTAAEQAPAGPEAAEAVETAAEPSTQEAPAEETVAEVEIEEPEAPVADAPVETVSEPETAEDVAEEPVAVDLPAEIAEPVAEAEIETPEIETPAAPAPDAAVSLLDDSSVAAKLDRIRAVVSRGKPEAEASYYTEDEHAEDYAEDFLAETVDQIEEMIEADDQAELEAEEAQEEDFSSIIAAVQKSKAEPAPELPEEAEYETEEEAELDAEEAIVAAEEEVKPAAEPVRPVRPVRVLKMKRADFEAAVETGQLEEEQEPESSLSPEDEADLLRELAEVEAEFAAGPEAEEDADEVRSIFAEAEEDEEERPEPARAQMEEPDLSRLMAKTQSEMDSPEGANRRKAIAHLRAAVAATRAETEAGGGLKQGDDSADAFRDDLNSVVRPHHPVRSKDSAPRPEPARPAPLKLVASQRIDTMIEKTTEAAPARPVMPVTPRRVRLNRDTARAPMQDNAGHYGSFPEFAEAKGAETLPDLLEAAAAYLSYVEGHDQFSRPQLMNKARQVEDLSFSREDGLRSFGQLLREGKIEKLQGGRFTVSDQIGFKPESRAAG